jgi:YgiT-type zinc finger domain-containing protein
VGRRRQKTERGQAMKCGICKAEMDETTVTYTEDIDQGVIVIRHVPAHVCIECGNIWYSGTIAAQLEKMIDRFASSAGTVVSVINFVKLMA